ncbi:MAG TPA: hypothetical protein VNN07_00135 [Candidatus Tectomicrobia bacterium]|nr:hypothetical protein [Candidatus Tectomicrobia bacterium]
MRKLAALALVTPALLIGAPVASHAGASTDAALALGSFAVLNQLVRGETILHDLFGGGREKVVVHQPPVVHAPPPRVVYTPPAAVIYTPPPVVYAPAPVYRVVPPGHVKHWKHAGHHHRHRHHHHHWHHRGHRH